MSRSVTSRRLVGLVALLAVPAVVLVAVPAIAEDGPPMPPIGNVDTTTPPPGAPTTDVIGEAPPPPPDLGGLPPELPPGLPAPEACYAGGGALSLRMSPTYAKITPTQSVTLAARLLQAGRVCQAGLPVRIYTRGPGMTTYHLSRTLTTNNEGLVRTTYVRPRADFRWYAVSVLEIGRAQSTAGLVQVR